MPVDPTLAARDRAVRARLPTWLWPVGALVFRWSPKPLYTQRNWLLRQFGARLDPTALLRPSVRIDRPWNLSMGRKASIGDGVVVWAHAPVRIGPRCTVSQYTRLAAFRHDDAQPGGPTRPAPITLDDDVWIATQCYVAGGQHVPAGVMVGARSVVDAPLPPWTVASGDPAVPRRARCYESRAR